MYRMYLGINEGEEGFILPVLPEKIEINENGNNKTFEVINLGEINTINLPKLTEISFESFFPKNYEPYVSVSSEQLFEPSFYISKIQEWRWNKLKIRFIFVETQLEVNDLFTIENFKLKEEGGEVGDIYYSIDLKRYKPYEAKKVIFNKDTNTATIESKLKRPAEKKKAKTHTVKDGDTLLTIAKKNLNDSERWKEVSKLNKNIINEDLITGQTLILP